MASLKKNIEQLLHECDGLLKAGQGGQAARLIRKVSLRGLPREQRLKLARMCRRAGLFMLGLKILSPLVQPERRKRMDPTTSELVEYAALLNFSGAGREALRILEMPENKNLPESLLFRAFCHFSFWQYAEAIPLLQEYQRRDLPPYALFVGRVNLASAYVAVNDEKNASSCLEQILEEARASGYTRLEGNCLEMRAQLAIRQENYGRAAADLKQAADLLSGDQTRDLFFVRKWMAVMEALVRKDLSALQEFKSEALNKNEWESVREADLYLQKVKFDREGFDHLYFGTPFPAYRERIRNETRQGPEGQVFLYGPKTAPYLDIVTGHFSNGLILNAAKRNHQLLEVLLSDLYRPITLGGLFGELFPGDHFDVVSSPPRIYQAIKRARSWLEENHLPLTIEETRGKYCLKTLAPFAFKLPLERPKTDWFEVQFLRLTSAFRETEVIRPSEAHARLDLSPTSLRRLTDWGTRTGRLRRHGSGPSTHYVFCGAETSKTAA